MKFSHEVSEVGFPMFRFSIRELFLITAVVALAVGWWIEHRGKTRATKEAALQEWKNRVLEVSLAGKGYAVKSEGKSVTLTGEGETSTYTPTSFDHDDGKGTRKRMDLSKKRPNGEPMPEYDFPQRPSSSPSSSR